MRTLPILATAVALAATLSAQTAVIPPSLATTDCCTSGNIWRAGMTLNQAIYDTTSFTGQGLTYPFVINNLEWRAGTGAINAGTFTYPQVEIYLGYSATDFLAPNTTFASNRTATFVQVYNGAVTLNPCVGGSPNTYVINLPLSTTFTYDPSTGQDLLVEIRILANPTPATGMPAMATGNVPATHLCNSVRNTTSGTALTGSLSGFACVVRFGYTAAPGAALATPYGTGCYNQSVSFYENFAPGTFDLSNSSVRLLPNGNGGYTAIPGTNQWFTPVAANLALADDAISPAQTMSFTFNYPGGSTNQLFVGSNGHVGLNAAGASLTPNITLPAFLNQGARISLFWNDLDPSSLGAGTIHFDDDPTNGAAYVTYVGVAMWETVPSTPRFLSTFQLALFNNGQAELRYQGCSAPTYNIFTGFTPGGTSTDPGTRDISATMPFSTFTDIAALALSSSARPVLGSSINLVTSNIPATVAVSATLLSFVRHNPGIDMTPFGMPGCRQFVNLDATYLVFGQPSGQIALGIPTGASWIGVTLGAQSASLVPGVNPLGAISSNGLTLLLGNL